jgi:predicted  nucleic acid-binding Zn-ribbon protein
MDNIKIKLMGKITSDLPINLFKEISAEAGVYEATSNPQGAISVILENGKRLGIRPGEFEFIEAPAWVLEKHGKLSEKYDGLVAEVEKLKQENKAEFDQYQIRLAVKDKEIDQSKHLNDSFAREIENLRRDIQQHIKWNESHTKRIVELSEENERLQNKNNELVKQLGSKVILDYEKGI